MVSESINGPSIRTLNQSSTKTGFKTYAGCADTTYGPSVEGPTVDGVRRLLQQTIFCRFSFDILHM